MDPRLPQSLIAQLGWEPATLVVSKLSGGLTNQNYRVSASLGDFVVRVFGGSAALLGIDRAHELLCSHIAADLNVGAEVIFAKDDVMVTRFLHGDTLTPEQATKRLPQIIAALKRSHEGPSFPGVFSPFEIVRRYAYLASERGVLLPKDALDSLTHFFQLGETLWPPPRLVPCHNDLLAGNFIDDGQNIRIIDWEYAAMGDPFFDLGNFAANQELDLSGCESLLVAYFGELRDEDLMRLQQMKKASDLREAFWGFLQSAISTLDFDYLGYAQTYLNRFISAGVRPAV
jgi:thiamine kinase-like enzyme